jgi:hypothetical protein
MNLAALFFTTAAIVIGVLGSVHLLYTFYGNKLHPRDAATVQAMTNSHPVLTRQTTIWRATKGFNASHSLGAILFALVFGYLALWHLRFLQDSWFLLGLGMATLLAYLALAWHFWFSIPLRGIALTSVLFAAGVVTTWVQASP